MDQKQYNPQNFSMEQAMKLAATPAGKQLITMLQQRGGDDFQKAMASAASGNFEMAKDSLSTILQDPKITALLKELGG